MLNHQSNNQSDIASIAQFSSLVAVTVAIAIAMLPANAQLSGTAVSNDATAYGASAQVPIRVVYPTPHDKIDAPKSFIVGCCHPGDSLTCNGEPVRTNKEGFFAHVILLKHGDNKFNLVESGAVSATREVHAVRKAEAVPLPPDKLTILKESFQPAFEMALPIGDTVYFKVRATPGSEVSVTIDRKTINLRTLANPATHAAVKKHKPAPPKSAAGGTSIALDSGTGVAYGKTVQRAANDKSDTYYGFYKVGPDDDWKDIHPKITARQNGKSVTCLSNFSIRVLRQPMLAETAHDDTIVRLGPNGGRTTPLVKGVRLLVDAWQGEQIRCIYAANKHIWIARQDLEWENDEGALAGMEKKFSGTAGPAPNAVAKTINVVEDDFGNYISIPLTQRLPYQVVQSVKPNTLVLKLFGVTSDTDWISDPRLSAGGEEEPGKSTNRHNLVESVTWTQPADGQYEVTIALKSHRQWGFKVNYDGSELRLHVRRPPVLEKNNVSQPLKGLKICVDPGHGGKEVGATGCSGINESAVNLAIGLRLQALLEKSGAHVVMTRTSDQDVSLDDRVRIANENKVDILLSVHNNSLPDGRDPWKERGSSAYWYHPQSTELGRYLKNGLLASLNLPDLGNRFQNLALARPSAMPAVLAEVGFMINPDEYALLISPDGQEAAAQGLLNGLKDYLLGTEHKSTEHKAGN